MLRLPRNRSASGWWNKRFDCLRCLRPTIPFYLNCSFSILARLLLGTVRANFLPIPELDHPMFNSIDPSQTAHSIPKAPPPGSIPQPKVDGLPFETVPDWNNIGL